MSTEKIQPSDQTPSKHLNPQYSEEEERKLREMLARPDLPVQARAVVEEGLLIMGCQP